MSVRCELDSFPCGHSHHYLDAAPRIMPIPANVDANNPSRRDKPEWSFASSFIGLTSQSGFFLSSRRCHAVVCM
jgi:hypothetical protein